MQSAAAGLDAYCFASFLSFRICLRDSVHSSNSECLEAYQWSVAKQ
jgi:hypothetical protein